MGMVWKRGETLGKGPPKIGWREALGAPYLVEPTTLLLLGVNLIPLFGVCFLEWDLFLLMVLYWMETGIIGFWHLLRLAVLTKWASLFLVPFFIFHFGMFMGVHFTFLCAFFGGDRWARVSGIGEFFLENLGPTGLWLPFLALFISHGFSFLNNFVRADRPREGAAPSVDLFGVLKKAREIQERVRRNKREGKSTPLDDSDLLEAEQMAKGLSGDFQSMMSEPYGRVMVMHLTIIFGGMITMLLPWKQAAYVLLVLLKMGVDAAAHARKNFKATEPGLSAAP